MTKKQFQEFHQLTDNEMLWIETILTEVNGKITRIWINHTGLD